MAASAALSLPLPPRPLPCHALIGRTASATVASGSSGEGSVALAVPPRAAGRARRETMMGAHVHQGARRWRAVRATMGGAEGGGGEGDGEGEADGKKGGGEGQHGWEAWQVAQRMYAAVNARDVAGAVACMAERCEYQDMIYRDALHGKQAVEQHLRRVLHAMPPGVAFIIDDISTGDTRACGASHTFHATPPPLLCKSPPLLPPLIAFIPSPPPSPPPIPFLPFLPPIPSSHSLLPSPPPFPIVSSSEVDGRPLPFSRGCSFIRCQPENGALRIVFVRDIPEPSFKPGSAALVSASAALVSASAALVSSSAPLPALLGGAAVEAPARIHQVTSFLQLIHPLPSLSPHPSGHQ
ncbi:unnamed protein product [Closterium sp. Naga37s-1]|nr:unnamed protein product [Closterium sp. Naga37s-1]